VKGWRWKWRWRWRRRRKTSNPPYSTNVEIEI
jgi:hypothetical protein